MAPSIMRRHVIERAPDEMANCFLRIAPAMIGRKIPKTRYEILPQSASQDYSMRSGSGAVLASRCSTPGQWVGAVSGTSHLTKFDGRKGVSGEYMLRFNDGSIEQGRFDATRRVVSLLCG
jgi:hypothetical protein